ITDRHRNRLPCVGHVLPAHQTFGRVHSDSAYRRLAQMLCDFQHQTLVVVRGFERIQDRRKVILELHVDDGADDLRDFSDCVGCGHVVLVSDYSASAPEMISISSLVIIAWRVRLYMSVCLRIISPALRVALSIALMRAPCSDAAFSNNARNTCTDRLRGSNSTRISSSSGSYS